jgi:hypothetical protein
MILECNVWCSEDDKSRELGLPDGDVWMPISIRVEAIITVKLAGPNDFIGENKATIYISGHQYFIVDKTYDEVIKIWKQQEPYYK